MHNLEDSKMYDFIVLNLAFNTASYLGINNSPRYGISLCDYVRRLSDTKWLEAYEYLQGSK
jgi:hypothetical protein